VWWIDVKHSSFDGSDSGHHRGGCGCCNSFRQFRSWLKIMNAYFPTINVKSIAIGNSHVFDPAVRQLKNEVVS